MIILGIDPGTATTGFGVIEKQNANTFTVLDFGVVSTSKDLSEAQRLKEIYDDVSALIGKYKPDCAGIEKLFFTNNQKTAMTVSAARGVVMLSLAQESVPTLEFTPLQVKSRICGFGGARKDQVQRVIKNTLKLTNIPKPDDAADALAIALCAGYAYRK